MTQERVSKDAAIERVVCQGPEPVSTPRRNAGGGPTRVRNLTERQMDVLDCIRAYVREHGVAPSRPEIAGALGIRNKSTVDGHLSALMKKGWIELHPGSPRNIRLLKDDLPLTIAGPIAAGEPILAVERITARIPRAVAEMFASQPDFFLRVEGDSMDRLGLVTGSVVAIKAQPVADDGDVVVARFEDSVTLKRYHRVDEQHVELHPKSTNPEHEVLQINLATDAFEIAGVAVGALIGDGFNRPEYDCAAA